MRRQVISRLKRCKYPRMNIRQSNDNIKYDSELDWSISNTRFLIGVSFIATCLLYRTLDKRLDRMDEVISKME